LLHSFQQDRLRIQEIPALVYRVLHPLRKMPVLAQTIVGAGDQPPDALEFRVFQISRFQLAVRDSPTDAVFLCLDRIVCRGSAAENSAPK